MTDWLNRCHFGDVRAVLRRMIEDGVQVHTIVTSPPYWGLRSYLPADHPDKALEIGSEPTIGEFIAGMVEVFDLCRQVLRDDGTMWVNMGDSYANDGKWGGSSGGKHVKALHGNTGVGRQKVSTGLKPKDLIGQPWRLAFALQDGTCACSTCGAVQPTSAWPVHNGHRICVTCLIEGKTDSKVLPATPGWWLRQEIIWAKPNPMPESVRDRCTKAHETIFLLAKSESYYFDQGAILEPVSPNTHARLSQNVQAQVGSERANGGAKTNGTMKAVGRRGVQPGNVPDGGVIKNNASFNEAMAIMPSSRNKRSVWTVGSEPYSGAHFATFPRALIEPCVLAGAPAGGIVLDPFFGSGTTGQVAQQLGRQFIGIDLNRANEPLQADRLRQPSLFLEAA